MDPHDPMARVLFLLIRDNIPPGLVERAIESARAVQKEVPDSALGAMASMYAREIRELSAPETDPRS